MKKMLCLLLIASTVSQIFPQISSIIPVSSSIAGTSVANTGLRSEFQNPAMLGYAKNSEIGMQHENRYALSELSTNSFQALLSTNAINADLSFSYFGYSLYHEMMTGLGFGRNFSDKFALGVRFNYYMAYFSASNSYRGALFPQIGLSYRFSSLFSLGFSTFNPFQTNIKTDFTQKRIPSIFSLGTEYYFSPDLVWLAQIDREISSNYRLATGFEYQMLQQVSLKLGAYDAGYLVPCGGCGLKWNRFLLDINCELHPLLGLNSYAGLRYIFSR